MGKLKCTVVCDDLVRKYCEQNPGNSINKGFEGMTYSNILNHEIYIHLYL